MGGGWWGEVIGRKWGTVAPRVEVVRHRLKVRARQWKMRGPKGGGLVTLGENQESSELYN